MEIAGYAHIQTLCVLLFNHCFIYLEKQKKDSGLHKCIILPCLPRFSLICKMIKQSLTEF